MINKIDFLAMNLTTDAGLFLLLENAKKMGYLKLLTPFPSEKSGYLIRKLGNAEIYIKEAKYDMAVGHFLLKLLWINEALFK
jgi:hypothetical protein